MSCQSRELVRQTPSEEEQVNMSEREKPPREGHPSRSKRYEVQFQKDSRYHSDAHDLEQAKLYARSLANFNHAAQVYDRLTRCIIFRTRAYADKKKMHRSSSHEEFKRHSPPQEHDPSKH